MAQVHTERKQLGTKCCGIGFEINSEGLQCRWGAGTGETGSVSAPATLLAAEGLIGPRGPMGCGDPMACGDCMGSGAHMGFGDAGGAGDPGGCGGIMAVDDPMAGDVGIDLASICRRVLVDLLGSVWGRCAATWMRRTMLEVTIVAKPVPPPDNAARPRAGRWTPSPAQRNQARPTVMGTSSKTTDARVRHGGHARPSKLQARPAKTAVAR